MKDFFTKISKQVLLFEICDLKKYKIEFKVVPIWVGHPVHSQNLKTFCINKTEEPSKTLPLYITLKKLNQITVPEKQPKVKSCDLVHFFSMGPKLKIPTEITPFF